MNNKVIYLLTGITGQLGKAFVRKLAKDKNNYIIGLCRDCNSESAKKVKSMGGENVILISAPQAEKGLLKSLLCLYRPDFIGHLAAQASVFESNNSPVENFTINTVYTVDVLNAVKESYSSTYRPKFFNISSIEIFGNSCGLLLDSRSEATPINPSNQYGVSKAAAHMYVDSFRDQYGIFANNIIASNFISEFQSSNFVAAKIFNYIKSGPSINNKLNLGNIDSIRDWMYVDDLIEAILVSLSGEAPSNYCVASGNVLSVKELLIEAFGKIGIANYLDYINIENKLFRIGDTNFVNINFEKIKSAGWTPKYNISKLINKILLEE